MKTYKCKCGNDKFTFKGKRMVCTKCGKILKWFNKK